MNNKENCATGQNLSSIPVQFYIIRRNVEKRFLVDFSNRASSNTNPLYFIPLVLQCRANLNTKKNHLERD